MIEKRPEDDKVLHTRMNLQCLTVTNEKNSSNSSNVPNCPRQDISQMRAIQKPKQYKVAHTSQGCSWQWEKEISKMELCLAKEEA